LSGTSGFRTSALYVRKAGMSKILLRHAYLDYVDNGKAFNALNDLNIAVKSGEFVSIIGSSGCGKSTILNVISGIRPLTKGELFIDNIPVTGPGKNRGIVFQHYSLFPWMTSKRNVSFGIQHACKGKNKKEIDEMAQQHLNRVGLQGFENKYPFQLSGGMQQRVAIARTLAMKPEILLMDEPFGAVDAKNKMVLQDLLLDLLLKENEQKTIVFVTHDVDEAILLSDRMLFMHNKKIEQEITIDFNRPRIREELFKTGRYREIRREIISLFYKDVLENIGGSEVVI
jgi:NitT/TauT family transport system ATP-binding protein